jgi:hypothetical protein
MKITELKANQFVFPQSIEEANELLQLILKNGPFHYVYIHRIFIENFQFCLIDDYVKLGYLQGFIKKEMAVNISITTSDSIKNLNIKYYPIKELQGFEIIPFSDIEQN